eukprot:m51a1_g1800 putative C-tail anchored protein (1599) ;mRNA; r:437863-444175
MPTFSVLVVGSQHPVDVELPVGPGVPLGEFRTALAAKLAQPSAEGETLTVEVALPRRPVQSPDCTASLDLLGYSGAEGPLYVHFCRHKNQEVRAPPAPPEQGTKLVVADKINDRIVEVTASLDDTFAELSARIQAATGVKPEDQLLFTAAGQTVDPKQGKKLSELGVTPEASRVVLLQATSEQRHRLQACDAYQPFQCRQTDDGLSAFLSCLYVLAEHFAAQASEGPISAFCRALDTFRPFPPAHVALRTLRGKPSQVTDTLKSALASYFWAVFRAVLPFESVVDGIVFEHSIECFALLLKCGGPETPSAFSEVQLQCPVSGERLTDPVAYKSTEVCSRKSLKDGEEAVPNEHVAKCLLCAPPLPAQQMYEWLGTPQQPTVPEGVASGTTVTQTSPPAAERKVSAMLESLAGRSWDEFKKVVAGPVSQSPVRPIPALNLASRAPSVTYDANLRVVANIGMTPCSVGEVDLFNPLTGTTTSVVPDTLAKTLAAKGKNVAKIVDEREAKEAVIVCLDTSTSMSDLSFSSSDAEDELPLFPLTEWQVRLEIGELLSQPMAYYLGKMCTTKQGIAHVIKELSNWTHTLKSIAANDHWSGILSEALARLPSTTHRPVPKQMAPPSSEAPTMQIFARGTHTVTLNVHPSYTVRQVAGMVSHSLHVPVQSASLVFAGRPLPRDSTLAEAGITANQTLQVMMWGEAESDSQYQWATLHTKQCPFFGPMKIKLPASCDVRAARVKIWYRTSLAPSMFSLWNGFTDKKVDGYRVGKLLTDDRSLSTYGKVDPATSIWNIEDVEISKAYDRKDTHRMERLDIVKQLFHAFINRSQAYNYPTQIGLVLFSSKARLTCPITPVLEEFRDHVEAAYPDGDTSLYDAISLAGQTLSSYAQEHPGCALRILCLTDGSDTTSTAKPEVVANCLQTNRITLDAISVADGLGNRQLHSIAKATGGYSFYPQKLEHALGLMELETVLFSLERPVIAPAAIVRTALNLRVLASTPLDPCDGSLVPERKQPSLLMQPVTTLEETLRKGDATEAPQPGSAPAAPPAQVRHIMTELRNISRHANPMYKVFPCSRTVTFWRVLMSGPENSPYAGGCWVIYVQFPDAFPLIAPEVRFVTPIKHCNVNPHGKICHSVFGRNWTSDTTMATALDCVYGLLLVPETQDPLDSNLAHQFFADRSAYDTAISDHVRAHANRPMQAWSEQLEKESEMGEAPSAEAVSKELECIVCCRQKRSTVLVPCGHFAMCATCAQNVTVCPGDTRALRELAMSEPGLASSELRTHAWLALARASFAAARAARGGGGGRGECAEDDGPCDADEARELREQVLKDTERSLWHVPQRLRQTKREELTQLVMSVLGRHRGLHYFQGYHDIAAVVLLTSGSESAARDIMESLSLGALRPWLHETMGPVRSMLGLLFPLLGHADRRVDAFLEQAGVQPLFALAWVLTWFAHCSDDVCALARLFDVFVAAHPLMPVYASASVVLAHADALLAVPCDPGSVHSFFAALPLLHGDSALADAEEIVRGARRLFDELPPRLLTARATREAPSFFEGDAGQRTDDFHVARRLAVEQRVARGRAVVRAASAAAACVAAVVIAYVSVGMFG